MGLDAYVRCGCLKQGIAKPHPFPQLLRLDENQEPYLEFAETLNEGQLTEHDQWLLSLCDHGGFLAKKRLGNAATIGMLRDFVMQRGLDKFQLLTGKVLYSGTHSGDALTVEQAKELLKEVDGLEQQGIPSVAAKRFIQDMREPCMASIETGNPIIF